MWSQFNPLCMGHGSSTCKFPQPTRTKAQCCTNHIVQPPRGMQSSNDAATCLRVVKPLSETIIFKNAFTNTSSTCTNSTMTIVSWHSLFSVTWTRRLRQRSAWFGSCQNFLRLKSDSLAKSPYQSRITSSLTFYTSQYNVYSGRTKCFGTSQNLKTLTLLYIIHLHFTYNLYKNLSHHGAEGFVHFVSLPSLCSLIHDFRA